MLKGSHVPCRGRQVEIPVARTEEKRDIRPVFGSLKKTSEKRRRTNGETKNIFNFRQMDLEGPQARAKAGKRPPLRRPPVAPSRRARQEMPGGGPDSAADLRRARASAKDWAWGGFGAGGFGAFFFSGGRGV